MNPKYKAYLLSDEWKAKREARKKKDGYKCKRCRSTKNLQVHHLTYKRIFNERLSDLVTTCDKCHNNYFHKNANIITRWYWKAQELATLIILSLFVASVLILGYNMYLSMTTY